MLHYFNKSAKRTLREQLDRAATNSMFRGMIGVSIAILFLIPLLDLLISDMPYQVWILLLLFIALSVFVWLIATLGGHWDKQKQRMQLSPMISVMIVALSISCVMGFYQQTFLLVEPLNSYLLSLIFAIIVVLMAFFTRLLDKIYR